MHVSVNKIPGRSKGKGGMASVELDTISIIPKVTQWYVLGTKYTLHAKIRYY